MSVAAPAWTTWVLLAAGAGAAFVYVGERSSRDRGDGGVAGLSSPLASGGDAQRSQNPLMDELRSALSRKLQNADVTGEPFAGFSWLPPPAPAAAPAKAVAPPFPFKYAGRIKEESGATRIYLTRGQDMLLVNAGDLLDGVFRIEALSDERIDIVFVPGGDRMSFELASLIGAPSPAAALPPQSAAPRQGLPSSVGAGLAPQSAAGSVPPGIAAGAAFSGGGAAPSSAAARAGASNPVPAASAAPAATPAPQTFAPVSRLGFDAGQIGSLGVPLSGPPIGFTPAGNSMTILPAPAGAFPMLAAPASGEKLGF